MVFAVVLDGYRPIASKWIVFRCVCGGLNIIFPFFGWFIPAYLGLYLISPMLNAFAEHTDNKSFAMYIVVFFVLQTFFDLIYRGWAIDGRGVFNYGYSIMTMAWLYLLGRYFRLFPPALVKKPARFHFWCYFLIFAISALLQFFVLYLVGYMGRGTCLVDVILKRSVAYTCPVVIAGTCFLFFAFLHMEFQHRYINRIAASVLGVFCFHSLPFYPMVVKYIWNEFSGVTVLLLDAVFIVIVFCVGVLVDQLRLLLWKVVNHE